MEMSIGCPTAGEGERVTRGDKPGRHVYERARRNRRHVSRAPKEARKARKPRAPTARAGHAAPERTAKRMKSSPSGNRDRKAGTASRRGHRLREVPVPGGIQSTARSTDAAHARYWLIVRPKRRVREPLLLGLSCDQATLPVFGCEEEASSFLRYAGLGSEWRAGEVSPLEVVAWLLRTSSGVARIVLDPPPDPQFRWAIELVSVGREEFVRSITGP